MVLGAITHLVWDSFTHAGRWGVEVVPWLHTEHLGLPGYKWAQFASGLLGLAVLVIWSLRRLIDTAPDSDGLRSTSGDRRVACALVTAGALVGVAWGLLHNDGSLESALYRGATAGGEGWPSAWSLRVGSGGCGRHAPPRSPVAPGSVPGMARSIATNTVGRP